MIEYIISYVLCGIQRFCCMSNTDYQDLRKKVGHILDETFSINIWWKQTLLNHFGQATHIQLIPKYFFKSKMLEFSLGCNKKFELQKIVS